MSKSVFTPGAANGTIGVESSDSFIYEDGDGDKDGDEDGDGDEEMEMI